jgi:hypothetical protein
MFFWSLELPLYKEVVCVYYAVRTEYICLSFVVVIKW